MHASLQRLAGLPPTTFVCPAHEYTEDNLLFAMSIESNNQKLMERFADVRTIPGPEAPFRQRCRLNSTAIPYTGRIVRDSAGGRRCRWCGSLCTDETIKNKGVQNEKGKYNPVQAGLIPIAFSISGSYTIIMTSLESD